MPSAWAINEDTGSPEYAAQELRRIAGMWLFPGVGHRFGARQGVRPHSSDVVTVSGTTWTVHDCQAVVYPGLTSVSGPYVVQQPETSGSLNPADGSNPRIDALDLQVRDDDEDSSGERDVRVVYVPGTPAGSPSAPSLTANSLRLATILVPASGSPSPSVQTLAPFTVASGGVLPVRDDGELPSAGRYEGMYVDHAADDELKRWSGGAMQAVASPQGYGLLSAMLGMQSQYTPGPHTASSGSFASLTGGPASTVTVPASGQVLVIFGCSIDIADQVPSRAARVRVTMSGSNSGQVGASDWLLAHRRGTDAVANRASKYAIHLQTGLNGGSTVFTTEYAISQGNADFADRFLLVVPLAVSL